MDSNYEYTWDSHTHTDRSYMSDSEVRDAISVSLHSMFFFDYRQALYYLLGYLVLASIT